LVPFDPLLVVVTYYTNGNDVVRCNVLLGTPEVRKKNSFIGSEAYATAYLLPEFVEEEIGIEIDGDLF
jgi:S-DNA-T family DNA segregation ATPase FtsK/SpoIIIE